MTGFLASAAVLLALLTVFHDRRDAAIARVFSSIAARQALTKPVPGEIAFDPGIPMVDPRPAEERR